MAVKGNNKVKKKEPFTIMVSSSVYNSEAELDQIKAILEGYGYKVIMSKEGSVYIPSGSSNLQACLKAVGDCDYFFGIIFPRFGSGITHKEFKEAVKLDKPRSFIAHYNVPTARELLKQYMYEKDGSKKKTFSYTSTGIIDDIRVIDMYNTAIMDDKPLAERKSNWVHPFMKHSDIQTFLTTQFADIERRREEVENLKKKK